MVDTEPAHDGAEPQKVPVKATPKEILRDRPPVPVNEETGKPAKVPDSGAWTYYVFHPYGRLFTAVSLTICNFMLYGEDPAVHGYLEAEMPVAGEALSLVAFDWPDMVGIVFVKVLIAIICVFLGNVIGRLVVHDLVLRDMCGLRFCGWEYHDIDDVRTSKPYNIFRTNTPYNRMWWGGEKLQNVGVRVPKELEIRAADSSQDVEMKTMLQSAHAKGWESALASNRAKGMSQHILGRDTVVDPKEYDYTREEYQENEQTVLEVVMPWLFKPRKHRDHSKGTILVQFGTTILVLALGAILYNSAIITIAYSGKNLDKYKLGPGIGMNEVEFGRFAACLCWIADLLNLITAFDATFQEVGKHGDAIREHFGEDADAVFAKLNENKYKRPRIAEIYDEDEQLQEAASLIQHQTPRFKIGYVNLGQAFASFWNRELAMGIEVRVLFIWIFVLTFGILILVAVAFDAVDWDKWSDEYGFNLKTNELERIILASAIAIQGPLTIIQDLEWPSFSTDDAELSLPGMNISEIECKFCCRCPTSWRTDRNSKTLPPKSLRFTTFWVTNKWITFVPFVLSLGLDYAMLFASWEYHPALYGQYVNPADDSICVTRNTTFGKEIKLAYETDKTVLANYTERFEEGLLDPVTGTDFCLPSRFTGVDSSAKFWAALPGVVMYLFFIYYLIKWTKLDEYIRLWETRPAKDEEDVMSPIQYLTQTGYKSSPAKRAAEVPTFEERAGTPQDVLV